MDLDCGMALYLLRVGLDVGRCFRTRALSGRALRVLCAAAVFDLMGIHPEPRGIELFGGLYIGLQGTLQGRRGGVECTPGDKRDEQSIPGSTTSWDST